MRQEAAALFRFALRQRSRVARSAGRWLLLACTAMLLQQPLPARAADATAARGIIHRILASEDGVVAGQPVARGRLSGIYAALDNRPIWSVEPGAEAAGEALLAALRSAAAQAVPAGDLHLEAIQRLASDVSISAVAERDLLLTDAFLGYADMLRNGVVPASALGSDWGIGVAPFDAAAALESAARGGNLGALLSSLAPREPGYGSLLQALRHYQRIEAVGGWPDQFGRSELRLDGNDPRLPDLRRRLTIEQDLSAADAAAAGSNLVPAVRRFQSRHGLDPDGRIGPRTLAELNTSAAQRVTQIAVNLERWRHLPHRLPARHIAVNVADASLELVESGRTRLQMRVIVGDQRHPTPVLAAKITAVTFNPPWNVPRSIAVREMLPKLRRNPDYLAANNIVIRGRDGDDPFGQSIDWRQVNARNFPYRLQQLPGPKNSLGGIKFEMANRFDVYLHDTPLKALFERSRRGFSHGCVRLQHAADLALVLLADPVRWNAETIAAALAAGGTEQVPLAQPVDVYVLYWTAYVDVEGRVNFRDDVYGRDRAIAAALASRQTAPPAQAPAVGCPVG